MPGYVYDAFSAACEQDGIAIAAQNECLVREWLATRGEMLVAPDKPARVKKEKPAKPPKPPKEPKPRKAKAAKKAQKTKRTKAVAPERVPEEKTEAGVLHRYSNGMEIEHLDEPTEAMEATDWMEIERGSYTGVDLAAGPDVSVETTVAIVPPEPEPEPEDDYIDDRIVVADDEFIDDDAGVAF
jgi:hypothetical protein